MPSEEVIFNTGFRTYHILGPFFVQVKLWLTKGSDVANLTIFQQHDSSSAISKVEFFQ